MKAYFAMVDIANGVAVKRMVVFSTGKKKAINIVLLNSPERSNDRVWVKKIDHKKTQFITADLAILQREYGPLKDAIKREKKKDKK